MGIPLSQMWTVTKYILTQRLVEKKRRYPLVLMLEPLFLCNLNCIGCGKIQYPKEVLNKRLSVEQCIKAVDECGAPIVSIPGGEPLLHPEMPEIVEELIKREKYIYLCTNGLLLKKKLDDYTPSSYFSFSVHLDGLEDEHDRSVSRKGAFKLALEGIKEALSRGFRVTTNTTIFENTDWRKLRKFFTEMMELGVEGMMISPGYSYEKAPKQDIFLKREISHQVFRKLFYPMERKWKFNQSPLFLEFLAGYRDFECSPWATPTYNIFGWQVPCYLIQDGYVQTFEELMLDTPWHMYGHASKNPKCANCMIHSGHEPSAVNYTFSSLKGLLATIKALLIGPTIPPPDEIQFEDIDNSTYMDQRQ